MPIFERHLSCSNGIGHNNIWTVSGGEVAVLYEPWDLDGTEFGDGEVVNYCIGDEITVKAQAHDNYHFVGWFITDPQASVPENYVTEPVLSTNVNYTYQPGVTMVSGVSDPINYVTAVFEADTQQVTTTHTVNFKDGNNIISSQSVNDGGHVTRPGTDPTKENNLFVDWYADPDFNNLFNFEDTVIQADTDIYAKWSLYAQINIGITPNAGSWDYSISPGSTSYANTMVLLSTVENHQVTFTATANTNYHFVGWYEGIMSDQTHFVDNHTDVLLSSDSTYTMTITKYINNVYAVFEQSTIHNEADYQFVATATESEVLGSGTDLAEYVNGKKYSLFNNNETANNNWLALYGEFDGVYKYPKEGAYTFVFLGQTYEGLGTANVTITNHYRVEYTEVTVTKREALQFQVWHNDGGATAIQYTIDDPNPNDIASRTELDFEPAVGTIYYGVEATVTARPDDGYHFVGWYHVDIDFDPFLETLVSVSLYKANPSDYYKDVFPCLCRVAKSIFDFAKSNKTFFLHAMSSFASPDTVSTSQINREYYGKICEVLQTMFAKMGNAHGGIKGRDFQLAVTFLGLVTSYVTCWNLHGDALDEKSVESLVRQFMHGIF